MISVGTSPIVTTAIAAIVKTTPAALTATLPLELRPSGCELDAVLGAFAG